jgi:hypothetical protein
MRIATVRLPRQRLTPRQLRFATRRWQALRTRGPMIDNFALGLSHGLMLLAAWLLLRRPDLDHEPGPRDRPEAKRRA